MKEFIEGTYRFERVRERRYFPNLALQVDQQLRIFPWWSSSAIVNL
jgi:hypothetical protein